MELNAGQEPEGDRFKDLMGVMVAVVALVTALAAWRGATAARAGGFEDYYALVAALNAEQARTLSTTTAVEHLTAFTDFAVHDERLAQLTQAGTRALSDDQRAVIHSQIDEAARLAANSRNFFPPRYVAQDGTYRLDQEIAEQIADTERRQDLSPEPHLEKGAAQDAKAFSFVLTIIALGAALLCFTLAGAFHAERKWLRRGFAAGGLVLLVLGAVAIVLIEYAGLTIVLT